MDSGKTWYIFAFFILFFIMGFSFLARDLTGAAEFDTGTVNFTLEESVSIALIDENSSFGSGYVSTSPQALINTEGTVENGTWPGNIDPMVLENQGNVLANVSISAQNDAQTFIGISGADFLAKASNNETNSCLSGILSSYTTIPTNNNTVFLCEALNFSENSNTINIDYELIIPSNAPSGDNSNLITLLATISNY